MHNQTSPFFLGQKDEEILGSLSMRGWIFIEMANMCQKAQGLHLLFPFTAWQSLMVSTPQATMF